MIEYTILSDTSSPGVKLTCGVPRGSFLGPDFFSLYAKTWFKVSFLRRRHYLCITVEPDTFSLNSTPECIEKCIELEEIAE